MKCFLCLLVLTTCGFSPVVHSQPEYLGLAGHSITAMDINFGLIAVGTDRNGVYWQSAGTVTDTGWIEIPMDSAVQTVYPHKSGPIGWAIGAGILPSNGQAPYVFCSFNGEDFEPNSAGLTSSQFTGVHAMDGFPDPSICGETYAVTTRTLYRRFYGDTLWQPVYAATDEGHLEIVKVREAYPGVVLLGGADGFAGILLARSLDFGVTWEDISPFGATLDIDFAGSEADTIFVASSDRIFRSVDGGDNWTIVLQDGVSFRLNEILYFQNELVYAGGSVSPDDHALLMVSHNFGESWEEVTLPELGPIIDLEASGDRVYFATRNEGVFRLEDVASSVDDIEQRSRALGSVRVYPNPAADQAVIAFDLHAHAHTVVDLLDASGRVVSNLLSEQLSPGSHNLRWVRANVPAGMYFVSLRVGSEGLLTRFVVPD